MGAVRSSLTSRAHSDDGLYDVSFCFVLTPSQLALNINSDPESRGLCRATPSCSVAILLGLVDKDNLVGIDNNVVHRLK
jgi:hypothetical protein